jgi:hypothetical protein
MTFSHAFQVVFVSIFFLNGASAATPEEDVLCKAKFRDVAPVAMKLSYWDFDQTESGWRKLAGCDSETALLLRLYVEKQESESRNLHWHLAQTFVLFGDNQGAIAEAIKSLNPEKAKQHSNLSWNAYVQATVEFLRNDRAAFDAQYELYRIAAVQNPQNQANFKVLTRLAECFGRPYKEAYASCQFHP